MKYSIPPLNIPPIQSYQSSVEEKLLTSIYLVSQRSYLERVAQIAHHAFHQISEQATAALMNCGALYFYGRYSESNTNQDNDLIKLSVPSIYILSTLTLSTKIFSLISSRIEKSKRQERVDKALQAFSERQTEGEYSFVSYKKRSVD